MSGNSLLVRLGVLLCGLIGAGWRAVGAVQQPPSQADARPLLPVEYYQLWQRARTRASVGDYAGAADDYIRLNRSFVYNGDLWFLLAESQRQAGQCANAIPAYRSAVRWGTNSREIQLTRGAAACFVATGQHDSALAWFKHGLVKYRIEGRRRWLTDSLFRPLVKDPRFRALAGAPPDQTLSRDAGWRYDLDYIMSEIQRLNARYSVVPLPDSVKQAAARLRARIPSLPDVDIPVHFHRIVAMLGYAHNDVYTTVSVPRSPMPNPVPVAFDLFPEGVFVSAADSTHLDLVGSRVTAVDDKPIAEVIDSLRPLAYLEANPERDPLQKFFRQPHALHAMGIARSSSQFEITVLDQRGATRAVLLEPGGRANQLLTRSVGAPSYEGRPDPLYLRRADTAYWLEPLPEHDALYVRFRMVRNRVEDPLPQFAKRVLAEAARINASNLIVDLRLNGGGSTSLYPPLLRSMIAFGEAAGHQVFVLTDRRVGSAAVNFALDVDRLTDAILVGDRTGGPPKAHGDADEFTLPWSGVQLRLSSVFWQLTGPRDDRVWISPDVPVITTAADYFANRDPVMEAVFALTGATRSKQ